MEKALKIMNEMNSRKVELAAFTSADFLTRLAQDAKQTYQKSVQYAKDMEQFLKKSRVLNAEANGLISAILEELDAFEAEGRKLGVDVTSSPIYKNAKNELGPLNNAEKMTARFKNL